MQEYQFKCKSPFFSAVSGSNARVDFRPPLIRQKMRCQVQMQEYDFGLLLHLTRLLLHLNLTTHFVTVDCLLLHLNLTLFTPR